MAGHRRYKSNLGCDLDKKNFEESFHSDTWSMPTGVWRAGSDSDIVLNYCLNFQEFPCWSQYSLRVVLLRVSSVTSQVTELTLGPALASLSIEHWSENHSRVKIIPASAQKLLREDQTD